METPTPFALQLLNVYLHPTETFIWQSLRQMETFTPLILADAQAHRERFPLPKAAWLQLKAKRPLLQRAMAWAQRRYAPVKHPGLAEAIKPYRPKIAHFHNGYRAVIGWEEVARLGIPAVVNFYGSDVSVRSQLERLRPGYATLFREAKALLVEGPAMRERLIGLGAPADKIHFIRIAIIPEEYRFRLRQRVDSRPVKWIFVGRLVEKKGLRIALEALATLPQSGEIEVIGDGPLRAKLEKQAQDLGLKARFRGMLTLDEMRTCMNEADALLAPSVTATDGDGEGGAPTVILEAQASGLPVITTDHDDIPFITLPGESALLAKQGNVEDYARVLNEFLASPEKWAAMGQAGQLHVATHHHARKVTQGLEDLYRKIVG